MGETAAARREISDAAVNLAPTGPITVNPTLTFSDGIVDGSANATDANGLPLAYTIVSNPSQGGKITFFPEATAGDFTYLPDATVLIGHGEQFSELVSETTRLDTSLENLPLVGRSRSRSLCSFTKRRSWTRPRADHRCLDDRALQQSMTPEHLGRPAAFTTKVTSFDGTPISTNFYPASGLQSGQSAPTILEGPGLGSGAHRPRVADRYLECPGPGPGHRPPSRRGVQRGHLGPPR